MTFLQTAIIVAVIGLATADLVLFIAKRATKGARERHKQKSDSSLEQLENLIETSKISMLYYMVPLLCIYLVVLSPYLMLAFMPETGVVLATLCVSYVAMTLLVTLVRVSRWNKTGDRKPMVSPDTAVLHSIVSLAILVLTVAMLIGA